MKNMKKVLALLLMILTIMSVFAACKKAEKAAEDAAKVDMNKISVEDLDKALDSGDYTIIDLRKEADYKEGHIPGAIPADLSVVVEGKDAAKGLEIIKKVIDGVDNKIVLVCYTGNKYAMAGTTALKEAGFKMDNVFTLDGGHKKWVEVFADKIEK